MTQSSVHKPQARALPSEREPIHYLCNLCSGTALVPTGLWTSPLIVIACCAPGVLLCPGCRQSAGEAERHYFDVVLARFEAPV
ncbi:hypothetical protein ACOMHN_062427 [Nucella lapillus]